MSLEPVPRAALPPCSTIASYGLERRTLTKYADELEEPRRAGIRRGFLSGMSTGATNGEAGECGIAGLICWLGSCIFL